MLMMRRSDFSLMMTMELIVCFWNSNVDGSAVEAFSLFPDGDDPLNAMLDNDELICDISDNDEAYGMFIEDNGGPKGTGCQCHQVDHDDPLVLESDFATKLDEAGIGYTEHQDQNLWNMGGATGSATQISAKLDASVPGVSRSYAIPDTCTAEGADRSNCSCEPSGINFPTVSY